MRRLATMSVAALATIAIAIGAAPIAAADAASPGQSMTHIKTVSGLASTLEKAGVIVYGKGGATTGVIGDSLAAADSQVVVHVPVTSAKGAVKHQGSTLALFNTAGDQQVQLRNPVIDLRAGVVRAQVGDGSSTVVFRIPNSASIRPKTTRDAATGTTTVTYAGARLVLAPGVGAVLAQALGLPSGSLPDGTPIATADVTLKGGR